MKKKKLSWNEMTPAQIGRARERYVINYFRSLGSENDSDIHWIALWVRNEVREAIKTERRLSPKPPLSEGGTS